MHDEQVFHLDALADLLAPSLPGARCRSEWELFDRAAGGHNRDDVAYARAQALALCWSCPVLDRCRDWFSALPAHDRPRGVVAGQLITKRSACAPW